MNIKKGKRLVISNDSYSWIKHCAGTILMNETPTELIILYKDDLKPIYKMSDLCKKAIYVQRKYDITNICRFLGVGKASNINHDGNIQKLATTLHLTLKLNKIDEIYYPFDEVLFSMIENMTDKIDNKTKKFIYGSSEKITNKVPSDFWNDYIMVKNKLVEIDNDNFDRKLKISNLMIGVPHPSYRMMYKKETFYEIKENS
jgi:hypothetical protein